MSAAILETLHDSGILTKPQQADLLNMAAHSIHPYHHDRPLRYEQLRTLMRRSGDPRVTRAFAADLLPAGWLCIYIEGPLDIDGDGDVDTADAIGSTLGSLEQMTDLLRALNDDGAALSAESVAGIRSAAQAAIEWLSTVGRIAQFLYDNCPRRRAARPFAAGTHHAAGGNGRPFNPRRAAGGCPSSPSSPSSPSEQEPADDRPPARR